MTRNIETLAKYLITKGVTSPLKLQKLLFFMRYEEIKDKKQKSFFSDENNFEAWIHGPVNRKIFFYVRDYFKNEDESEEFFLTDSETKEIDQEYENYFLYWNDYSSQELVDKSHNIQSWINARGDTPKRSPSTEFLKEDESFIKSFDDNQL